jgi:hypothetical protein
MMPALQYTMIGSLRHRQCAALWQLLEPLLDAADAADAASAPRILVGRAASAYSNLLAVTRPKQALQRAQQAVQALRGTPDRVGLYIALACLSWPAAHLGELTVAKEAIDSMRMLEDPNWPPVVRVHGAEGRYFTSQASGAWWRALYAARQHARLARAAGKSNSVALNHIVDASLAAGRAQEAADAARKLIAQIDGGRERRVLSYARLNLTAALLATDKPDEAREVAKEGWPHAALFGTQAPWADHLALLAALSGRPHAAARLIGYADALYRAREDRRQVNEARSVQRAVRLARDALGTDEVAVLTAEGAAFSDADADRLALGNDAVV